MTFKVDPNPTTSERSATLVIAGQVFGVTQNPLVCTYTLTTDPAGFGKLGGDGTFSYSASGGSCTPVVQSYANWLAVTGSSFRRC